MIQLAYRLAELLRLPGVIRNLDEFNDPTTGIQVAVKVERCIRSLQ